MLLKGPQSARWGSRFVAQGLVTAILAGSYKQTKEKRQVPHGEATGCDLFIVTTRVFPPPPEGGLFPLIPSRTIHEGVSG